MPIECTLLEGEPVALDRCPKCGVWPFTPFMRGQVQRSGRKWFIGPRQDYCALICSDCKEIVGHESPPGMIDDDRLFTVLLWIATPIAAVLLALGFALVLFWIRHGHGL